MITYKVKLTGRKKSESVTADYFKIEAGILTFRNVSRTQGGYPTFVKCYAPGVWLSIENEEASASE